MIKKLILKLLGKQVAEKLDLKDDVAPAPGQAMVSVPWYRSKAKLGFLVAIIATILKLGPPILGKPPVEIPQPLIDLLQQLGITVGLYGLRDAHKTPA